MSSTYKSLDYDTNGYALPSIDPGLAHVKVVAHSSIPWGAPVANDVGYMFNIPANAVVTDVVLKADGQLDSNGSPTLTWDVGVVGTTQLFMAAVATVGRASTASAAGQSAMAGGGLLYQNTTGADQAIMVTAHASAATGVAGTVELAVEYYVKPTPGNPV
jgi:hypothetical protein